MEKIYLKPASQDILIKGASSEGHLDVFSYNPSGESDKKLGSIFIVGHVHHETDDVTYSVNLIASLAKREYYANPNLSPRDAFAATLKKANEVVEDFFEHEGLKLDIGVFAVAGEQIFLSKLGKFKLLLARDGRAIDVLNNVDLFSKETVTAEQKFSNIISGKVSEKDRLLAFYPSRSLTARERYFKADLLSLPAAQFVAKMNTIKEEKADFSCAAVYVDLHKVREIASAPRIEPQEPVTRVASAPAIKPKPAAVATKQPAKPSTPPPTSSRTTQAENAPEPVYAAPVSIKHIDPQAYTPPKEEAPRIIPSEFSLGKKHNVILAAWHRIRFINLTPRNKAILSFGLAALIISASFGVKLLFVTDPGAKHVQEAIDQANMDMQLARTKVGQQDIAGARSTLIASLANIGSLANADSSKTQPVNQQLMSLLDELDQAQEASPAFVAQVPVDYGKASLLAASADVFVYAYNATTKNGTIAKVHNEGVTDERSTPEINANLMFVNKESASIIDTVAHTIITWGTDKAKSSSFAVPDGLTTMYLYEDNLYMAGTSGIHKIVDASKGGALKPWLVAGQTMIPDPVLMAVDGDIFVLSKSGILATYYKGKKQSEVSTGLAVTSDQLLLTTNDSPSLFVVDKKMRRIYILDKKTGKLQKTLKVDSNEPFVTAAVDNTGSVYFSTSDNKIWKVQ
jgi:hypothetical protein